ncbi:hypothetical protein [Hymenobacter fodinae]|uniref:Uncharacterized protein n=1 Tax=Hymenobacter fodinae TaxID=2510796 RepID=A0A4Z0P0Z4_9BACT|nr:hypothetical protein [Hymenobacter fodinae]TGE04825.1 hypothetical protein EU556_21850 [Hymenobacter fodinae]
MKQLLPLCVSLWALTSCEKKTGEVQPTHKVTVDVRTKNSSSDYEGRVLVRKATAQSLTTVYSKSIQRGSDSFIHNEKPVPAGTTYTAEVQFYPLTGRAGASLSGSIQATIKVDGAVKNTVTISNGTPANSAGVRSATISTTL